MSRPSTYNLIYNVAGALIGLSLVGYIAYSFLSNDDEPPCTARYPAPTQFALETADGAPLSPIELQARVGLREWGVIENARVIPVEGSTGAALEVKLASATDHATVAQRQANGIDFRWSPLGMKSPNAACLSYSVWLPEGFAFNDGGGVLPGIIGGLPAPAQSSIADRFAARLQWAGDGKGTLYVAAAGHAYREVNFGGFPLPVGRWMRVEQELVLNKPGEANGVVRLWADGALKAEDKGLDLRKNDNAKITGVLADVGYMRQPGPAASLRLSPFELAWR